MNPLLEKYSERFARSAEESGRFWEGSFGEYLNIVKEDPKVTRNAFERLYDMIVSAGTEVAEERDGEKFDRYLFFDDPVDNGLDAIFGLHKPLSDFVNNLKSAALGYGTQKRILLLHGPVGSSKSTIARLLKKGLERYSATKEGALYTLSWKTSACFNFKNQDMVAALSGEADYMPCPMHEEPLHALPLSMRGNFLEEFIGKGKVKIEGELCPFCQKVFEDNIAKYKGDFYSLIKECVRVNRLLLSERNRIGIGTFQPKDEKNQDSTELTGDINYRNVPILGKDSDPRAFDFDGEFNIANRGMVELVEVLKLDVAFLYDLLGASQEHKIKPKKISQMDIDEVLLGHTNEPEYRKLQNNEFMQAFQDRTVKVDIPYVTVLNDEIKIYEKDFNSSKVKGKHIAPHTLEMAALWVVLTRLEVPKNASLTLLQKLKLYNGKTLPGFTQDNIQELKAQALREGMSGISPRYCQDKISNALVAHPEAKCVNPFMVLMEIEEGLRHHPLITSEQDKTRYSEFIAVVKEEYEAIVKNEVQMAISADEDALKRLCGNYIDNVKAYTQKEKVKNKFTGQMEEPDHRLMRSIEEKIDIPESRKDDFRREIMNYIGALSLDKKGFDYRTNERLQRALELKLFEDQKDSIKLTSLVSGVIDPKTQEKIDVVKSRLIKIYGYCEDCSTDILLFVASIFARGDSTKKK